MKATFFIIHLAGFSASYHNWRLLPSAKIGQLFSTCIERDVQHLEAAGQGMGRVCQYGMVDLADAFRRIMPGLVDKMGIGGHSIDLAAQDGGSIINISAVGGAVPDVSQVAYGTSKAAINYLTKLIAVHEAKHHIRCNAVLLRHDCHQGRWGNLLGKEMRR